MGEAESATLQAKMKKEKEKKEERFFSPEIFVERSGTREEKTDMQEDSQRRWWRGCLPRPMTQKKEPPRRISEVLKMAATYSPTMQRSTIGDAELNDPVRNGKGWDLSAITT